jgi:hypothetical protein
MSTTASVELALQGEIVRILKADAGIGTGDRVYDSVPRDREFPYVNIGEDQVLGDDADECAEGSEIFVRIHAWSRAVGWPEVKAIGWNIRDRIRGAAFNMPGFSVDVIEFVQAQYLRDPDGQTRHAVIEFRFLVSHVGG